MAETYEGGCTCGAVRYRLTDAPMFAHCCHCTSCQTETGSDVLHRESPTTENRRPGGQEIMRQTGRLSATLLLTIPVTS